MDRGAQRGRGVDARVQPHQAAPAPVQHQAARRQELPVPGSDHGRAVPEGAGDAWAETKGDALLRAVRARLRHPRNARPPAAQLPGAHLQPGQVQRTPAPRSSVPAVPHREVQRAVCGRDRRDAVPPARPRAVRVPRRRHRRHPPAARGRDEAGSERARVRARRTAARPADQRAARRREAADGG